MLDMVGNHIVGFPTRRLICRPSLTLTCSVCFCLFSVRSFMNSDLTIFFQSGPDVVGLFPSSVVADDELSTMSVSDILNYGSVKQRKAVI